MKKSKFYLVALFLLVTQLVMAQPENGMNLVGGNVGFTFNNDDDVSAYSLSMNPYYLSFINDNIALGSGIFLGYESLGSFNAMTLSVFPMARYYFTSSNEKMVFFAQGLAGYTLLKSSFSDQINSGFTFSAGPGIAFMLNDNVSIDTVVSYNRILGDIGVSDISFTVGFQVWLGSENSN